MNIEDVIDNVRVSVIKESSVHGYGLFASDRIKAGEILGYLDGQEIPWALHQKYELANEWNALTPDRLLVRPYRTKYSFINHSRQPNLKLEKDPLRIVALTDISINEELTLDYRMEPLPEEYLRTHGQTYL